jgi:hypothetical protein
VLCKHEVVGSIPSGSTNVLGGGSDEREPRRSVLPVRFISLSSAKALDVKKAERPEMRISILCRPLVFGSLTL